MNQRIKRILIPLLLVVILVAACTPQATPTVEVPETEVPTKASVEEVEPTEEVEQTEEVEPTEEALAPLDPVEKVKMAYVPIMKFATSYVAKERGFFEKQGLDVEMVPVKSGTEAIAFLSEGKIDVGGVAIVVSLWNGWASGLDLRIIAPGALEPFTDSPTIFLVRKDLIDDGTVTSIADLQGMTVAVAGGPGSGGEYLTSKALERGDLTIFDVDLVNIGNADMPAAFENGSIDAGLLGSPYAQDVINSEFASAFIEDITPGLMTVAFVGSGEFIDERPEVAQRFVLALAEAANAMQGEDYLSDANIAAYLAHVSSTPEDIKAGTPVVYDPELNIPVDGLAEVERIHRENGRLEYTDPLDMSNVVDTSFVEWALDHLSK